MKLAACLALACAADPAGTAIIADAGVDLSPEAAPVACTFPASDNPCPSGEACGLGCGTGGTAWLCAPQRARTGGAPCPGGQVDCGVGEACYAGPGGLLCRNLCVADAHCTAPLRCRSTTVAYMARCPAGLCPCGALPGVGLCLP